MHMIAGSSVVAAVAILTTQFPVELIGSLEMVNFIAIHKLGLAEIRRGEICMSAKFTNGGNSNVHNLF